YSFSGNATGSMDTSLQIAQLPVLTGRVESALAKRGVDPSTIHGLGAGAVGTTNLIRFTAQTGSAATAPLVATEYARQFATYYQRLDTQAITQAINGLQERIDSLRAQGTRQSRADALALQSKVSQLETLLTLQTATAVLVRQGAVATKIRPTPKKF